MKYTVYLIKYNDNVMHIGTTNNFKRKCREQRYNGTKNSVIPKDVDMNNVEFVTVGEYETKEEAKTIVLQLINQYNINHNTDWNKPHHKHIPTPVETNTHTDSHKIVKPVDVPKVVVEQPVQRIVQPIKPKPSMPAKPTAPEKPKQTTPTEPVTKTVTLKPKKHTPVTIGLGRKRVRKMYAWHQ